MNFPILAGLNVDWLLYLTLVSSVYFGVRYRHTFFVLPIVICVSLIAEDTFYPFSHFPMYSDPDESENYLYIGTWEKDTDTPEFTDITPLAVREYTGVTAPKVKKLQKAWIRDRADELGVKDSLMAIKEKEKEWQKVLNYLRDRERRGLKLPDKLALVEVWIETDDEAGYKETGAVVAFQTQRPEETPEKP